MNVPLQLFGPNANAAMSSKRPDKGLFVTKSELMVFSDVPPVQLAVEDSFVETVKCPNLAPLDYRAPLEFQVRTTCIIFK